MKVFRCASEAHLVETYPDLGRAGEAAYLDPGRADEDVI